MNWAQFLQDEKGEASSTRLGILIAVCGLVLTMIIMALLGRPEIGVVAGALATLSAAAFVGGKMSSDSVIKTQMQNSSPPPRPPTTDRKTDASVSDS